MVEHVVPYSGKFSQVQTFAKMPPEAPEEIFAVLTFATNAYGNHTHTALFTSLMVAGLSVRESGSRGLGRESTEAK